jgi:hypothetical protein
VPEAAISRNADPLTQGWPWVEAGNLRIGDRLLLKSGREAAVERLGLRHVQEPVYNIEVETVHTYAVGSCELLVHNKP